MKIMTENKCMTANQEENVVAEKNRKKVKIHVREMTFIAMMGAIGSILVFSVPRHQLFAAIFIF